MKARRVVRCWGSHTFYITGSQMAASLTHWLPFTHRKIQHYLFLLRDWLDRRAISQLEGLSQLKNPMTLRIEPTTFLSQPTACLPFLFVVTHFYDLFYDRLCGLTVRDPGCRSRGPGSILGATRFFWVWNGVHSASWVQLRSYLEEKVAASV
jgi:hypothetical protein